MTQTSICLPCVLSDDCTTTYACVKAFRLGRGAQCRLGGETDIEDVFPPSVTMLLYGFSIAVARERLNERIRRNRDEQFVPRGCRLLESSWIDKQSRQVLMDWLEMLRK